MAEISSKLDLKASHEISSDSPAARRVLLLFTSIELNSLSLAYLTSGKMQVALKCLKSKWLLLAIIKGVANGSCPKKSS